MSRNVLIALLGIAALFFVVVVGAVVVGILAFFVVRSDVVQAAAPVETVIDALQLEPEVQLDRDRGILVAGVDPGSPAEAAGLVRGDIITEVNGETVNLAQEFFEMLYNDLEAGDTIELTVIHGDEQRTLTAELGEQDGRPYLGIESCGAQGRIIRRGLRGAPDWFSMPFLFQSGVVVTEVLPDSPAEEAGLQAGDVIIEIDGEELGPEQPLEDVIQAHEPGDEVLLTVEREGEEEPVQVEVTLGEHPDEPGRAYLGIRYSRGMSRSMMPEFMLWREEGIERPFGPLPLPIPEMPEGITSAAVIVAVVPDGPADEAGLATGDFIIAVDGEAVTNHQEFVDAIRSREPGGRVELTVLTPGEQDPQTVEVTLGEHPDEPGRAYLGVNVGSIEIREKEFPDEQNQPVSSLSSS